MLYSSSEAMPTNFRAFREMAEVLRCNGQYLPDTVNYPPHIRHKSLQVSG